MISSCSEKHQVKLAELDGILEWDVSEISNLVWLFPGDGMAWGWCHNEVRASLDIGWSDGLKGGDWCTLEGLNTSGSGGEHVEKGWVEDDGLHFNFLINNYK